jgi:hypothetical protein
LKLGGSKGLGYPFRQKCKFGVHVEVKVCRATFSGPEPDQFPTELTRGIVVRGELAFKFLVLNDYYWRTCSLTDEIATPRIWDQPG